MGMRGDQRGFAEMAGNEVLVTALLPEEANGFRYVRNHHFIEFEDKDGHTLKVIPEGCMLYSCPNPTTASSTAPSVSPR